MAKPLFRSATKRPRHRRIALAASIGVVAVFAAVTLVALEGSEVVVLRTFGDAGAVRETRTWVADDDGYAWIEAANADRPFLRDITGNPDIEMRRGGVIRHCHAMPLPNPDGHAHIRRLLARRYGWADRWIGWLTDTSHSIGVRIVCR